MSSTSRSGGWDKVDLLPYYNHQPKLAGSTDPVPTGLGSSVEGRNPRSHSRLSDLESDRRDRRVRTPSVLDVSGSTL